MLGEPVAVIVESRGKRSSELPEEPRQLGLYGELTDQKVIKSVDEWLRASGFPPDEELSETVTLRMDFERIYRSVVY